MSILLIEEEPKYRKSLSSYLNQYGYKIIECPSWKKAIEIIKEEDIGLILANTKITNASILKFSSKDNMPEYIAFSSDSRRMTNEPIFFKSLYSKFLCYKINALHKEKIKPKNKVKIIIVDPNEIIRFGVKAIIDNINFFEFVGGAPDASGAKKLIKKTQPDILLLGVSFSQNNDVKKWRTLKRQYPHIHFIVLTDNIAPSIELKNIIQWVDGILLKNSDQCDIMYAIDKVMSGGRVIDPLIAKKMLEFASSKNGKKLHSLKEQEIKILYGLTVGKTDEQLAEDLCLSPSTIRNYISRILHKLNLPNRTAAVAYAFEVLNIKF